MCYSVTSKMLMLNVVGFLIWLILQAVVSSNLMVRLQLNVKNKSEDNFTTEETTNFDGKQTTTVISFGETQASADGPFNSKFDSPYTIFIGIFGTGLLFLLLAFVKGIQWYRKLKSLLHGNQTDDITSDGSMQ